MIPLIPYQYLNEVCFLSLNEDDKKYQIALDAAQETLFDLIGEDFYTEIETQYVNDTFTTDNDTFYNNYLKVYLAWQTCYEYLGISQFNHTPTGLRQFVDENSTVLEDFKLWSAEKNILRYVNRKKGRMINYLEVSKENDSTRYTLYTCKCNTEMNWGITSVSGNEYTMHKVNKNILRNE